MSAAKKILLVDDDQPLRESLIEQLELNGEFTCAEAGTGRDGAWKQPSPTCSTWSFLMWALPDQDGREICRQMRKAGVTCPIIMLTGADTDADQILGLESGANDYITKPFKFSVLMARLRAHLRSHEQSEDAVFKIGPYTFQPAAKQLVTEEGKKVRLTEKETNILKFLYRSGDKVVTRDVLLQEVWGYNAGVTTHTLETHIYRLRQKIEPDPANARLLITESGGYKLAP